VVLCTANRCRSPLAAALLHKVLAERGVSAEVDALGLLERGHPAPAETVAVAATRGLDLSDHRSRRLDAAVVSHADLVLAMERRHVREVVAADPVTWPRTFTLKEIVRRGQRSGGRKSGEALTTWIARAHEGRRSRELLGASELDDVADPVGRPLGEHEDLALELEDLTRDLAELMFPTD
jgi:protein-tyrosine phosphatase